MSLQVNLSSREISQAYQDVLNARGIDWALFTYEKGSNDLKVQSTGSGGLEELAEEFSDARYATTSLELRCRADASIGQHAVCVRPCPRSECKRSGTISLDRILRHS
jgi:hypothetical protein